MCDLYNQFIGQYSESKTLRFELLPCGETLKYIQKSGILEEDKKRAEDYLRVKHLLDEYHKRFISEILGKLDLGSLSDYYSYYTISNKTDQQKKKLQTMEEELRKKISQAFHKDKRFKRLFSKEMITEDLKRIACGPEDLASIESFQRFTTYFLGFYENRKNIYSEEAQATAISFRIVNQNLPRFLDNIRAFRVIMESELRERVEELQEQLKEELNGHRIEDYFRPDFYSQLLTNEAITLYNTILGGKFLPDGKTKVKGINEYVNLYQQKKLPKLKMLYKQILSDRKTLSFVEEQFKSDGELLREVRETVLRLKREFLDEDSENPLRELMGNITSYDLNGIYLTNGPAVSNLSQAVFGDWSVIRTCMEKEYDESNSKKKKDEKYFEKRNRQIKRRESFSLGELNQLVEKYGGQEAKLEQYYASLAKRDGKDLIDLFEEAYKQAEILLSEDDLNRRGLSADKKRVALLKKLMDSLKNLEGFVKPLLGKGNEAGKDGRFYGELDAAYSQLREAVPLYNRVRNYLTRKPYSTEKIKLNFQASTLLNGWDINKEKDNLAVILRKDGLYFLGIMGKKSNLVFREEFPENSGDCYEKMEYKLLPGPNKMLPKVFFSKSGIKTYQPSERILDIYRRGAHKVGDSFNLEECHELIDFFKESIEKHEDWKKFGFHFSDTQEYKDISQFYHEVERQGYMVRFRNIPVSYIDSLVKSGKLYLFQIYNKDFSPCSKGRPNLHTVYWKMLFDERNLRNVVYKLNGEAEVFYRKASITGDNLFMHKKEEPIKKRSMEVKQEGKSAICPGNLAEGEGNEMDKTEQETSLFPYDIIKDRRYTMDKFLFHVPITMNFCAQGTSQLNAKVMEALRSVERVYAIGIDRGERNLLYYSVVAPDGSIADQGSLNVIENDRGYHQDYRALLEIKERKREEARESWMEIESIKELKAGYLSQVIHKIVCLMMKYQGILVMEDLNFGFMNSRKKVERQVYQKFEKMLIDKLNYLVFKDRDPQEAGGALNAYQLTSAFTSFARLGQQSGFLFYIPAWNTSNIDPTTGFVNLFRIKYSNQNEARNFIRQFDRIYFNKKEGYFEFSFDYKNFTDRATGPKTKWTVCSYGDRVRYGMVNGKKVQEKVDITDKISDLLRQYQVSLDCENLVEEICKVDGKDFYMEFFSCLRLVLQMRNSVSGMARDLEEARKMDYLLSPVKNKTGEFFDSREADGNLLPIDADANGAYNIARKGLWIIEQIRKSADNRVRLSMTNAEWLEYAQTHIL